MCLLLFASFPAGAQWQTRPLPANLNANLVIPYRAPAGKILVSAGGTYSQPVLYRSNDDGQSWLAAPLDKPLLRLFTVPTSTDPPGQDGPLYGVFLVGGGWLESFVCELRRSGDAGVTWTVLSPASRGCNLAIDPTSPQVMYAAGIGEVGPAYGARSLDGGATWETLYQSIQWWIYQFRMGADGAVYALAGNPFVSRDHGTTFMELNVRQQTGGQVNDLLALRHPVYGDGFVLVATTNGLYKTIDGGTTWLPAGFQGYEVKTLTALAQPPGSAPQVVVGYRQGLALWKEDAIVSLSNGLPYIPTSITVGGVGVVTSTAGLSICNDLPSCIGGTLPQVATLVEFRNSVSGHYFMTLEGAESRGLDAGAAGPGWSRTGYAFKVYADAQAALSTVNPACRFYGTPGLGPDSHFYTLDANECIQVQKDLGWTLESPVAFAAIVPKVGYDQVSRTLTFDCIDKRPVYRVYNNHFASNDSNHRYVDDPNLYQSMQAAGWKGEGVQFCELP
jgi:photosystem II stability/assembly factor-like uncharacterized protein